MYKLFAGDNYYPSGGYGDFKGKFATLEEAVAATQEPSRIPSISPPSFFAIGITDPIRKAEHDAAWKTYNDNVTYSDGPLENKYDWWHVIHKGRYVAEGNQKGRTY